MVKVLIDLIDNMVKKKEIEKNEKDKKTLKKEFFKVVKHTKKSDLLDVFVILFLFLPLFIFGIYYIISKWNQMTKRVAWLTVLFLIFALFANSNNGLFLIIALVIIRYRDNFDIAMENIFEKNELTNSCHILK